jgi:hypothetical protein
MPPREGEGGREGGGGGGKALLFYIYRLKVLVGRIPWPPRETGGIPPNRGVRSSSRALGNRLNTIYHYHPLPQHYHPLPPITQAAGAAATACASPRIPSYPVWPRMACACRAPAPAPLPLPPHEARKGGCPGLRLGPRGPVACRSIPIRPHHAAHANPIPHANPMLTIMLTANPMPTPSC